MIAVKPLSVLSFTEQVLVSHHLTLSLGLVELRPSDPTRSFSFMGGKMFTHTFLIPLSCGFMVKQRSATLILLNIEGQKL